MDFRTPICYTPRPLRRILLISALLGSSALWACARSVAPWNADLNFEEMEWRLAGDEIRKVESLADYLKRHGKTYSGNLEAYVVTLESGVVAIAKFSENLRPLRAAYGAYRAGRTFGFRIIPPTVMREFKNFGRRTGLLQIFVESPFDLHKKDQRAKAYHLVSQKDRSDLIAAKFILGRWDNHRGNEIIDATGTPALIDSDEILDLQQVRYGECAYIRYGDVPGIWMGDSRINLLTDDWILDIPFDFDNPHVLKGINRAALFWRFGGYLEQSAMEKLWMEWVRREFEKDTIRSQDWSGRVWIQWNTVGNKPLYTDIYSQDTIEHLSLVEPHDLRAELPPAFTDIHIHLMLNRRDQFVRASMNKTMIP